ncbi:methyl-accepting chemotaxis protein [Shewanella yunxiaonensis]|uniref:Methyl-accepting chemotaxis protein n=1 Tax=Shewanella yunxiaonensis TaxID=2829809 RepID=A0ABX7YVH2_9GAMM|nr:methyl-accepting chemotaxis protein [Shewanella yunxiaonensis]QUN06812.1 methyl-accepting chemotaxis protein [Shewanella yunxiaonensis]
MNFRNWPIAKQIGTLAFILTVLVFGIVGVFSYKTAAQALKDKALSAMAKEMHSVNDLLELQYKSLLVIADRNASVFNEMYPGEFSKPVGETTDVMGKATPTLKHNNELVNSSISKVDRFANLTGGNATVFVKDGDDFLRISTSLKKADGTRAVGTYLGKNHPGYNKLLNGENYKGYANLFGKDYMTEYRAIKDKQGTVVGILYTGFDISESLAQIKQAVKQLRIEESGSYSLLNQEQSVVADNILPEGEKPTAAQLDGLPLQALLNDHNLQQYQSADGTPMYAMSDVIPGWQWLLVGKVKAKELNEESTTLLLINTAASFVGILAITAFLSLVLLNTVKPLRRLQLHMEELGKGDLSVDLPATDSQSNNEVSRITASARHMTQNLRQLIQELLNSVQTVDYQAEQAQEIAKLNGEEAKALMGQTDQIATAIEEMSTSIRDVANHAGQSAEQSAEVDSASRDGHQQLRQVVDSLKTLAQQLNLSQQAVEGVAKESEAINTITDVINGIAEQTNLLALNAAIEAARAGEQGRGFAVVADEVRTLASRTQASISEISQTIVHLQAKIKDTASRMTQSHELGNSSANQGEAANQQLSAITERIASLAISVSSIASATEQQSAVADEVTRNLHEITELAREGDTRAHETVKSAQELADVAAALKRQIGVFRV